MKKLSLGERNMIAKAIKQWHHGGSSNIFQRQAD